MNAYMRRRRQQRRQELLKLAGGVCVHCGDTTDLEFDHRDRNTRKFGLSGSGLDKSWEQILKEFVKCDLLCKYHHQEKTKLHKESGGGHNKVEPTCGSAHAYTLGCRCNLCKVAKRLYRNKDIDYHTVIDADYPIKANGPGC